LIFLNPFHLKKYKDEDKIKVNGSINKISKILEGTQLKEPLNIRTKIDFKNN
jgi:hypothetical protein